MYLHLLIRANASLNLERQIKKVDGIVSGLEKNLSVDGPIPEEPNAIQRRNEEIQVRGYCFLLEIYKSSNIPRLF